MNLKSIIPGILCCLLLFSCKKDPGNSNNNNPPDDPVIPPPAGGSQVIKDQPRILFTAADLPRLQQAAAASPLWATLRTRMSNHIAGGQPTYGIGPMHYALMYAIEKDNKFATKAIADLFKSFQEDPQGPKGGSYLRASGYALDAAVTADLCGSFLTNQQKKQIYDYLETIAKEIVEVKNWSGWGWLPTNPYFSELNNYHSGHLLAIYCYVVTCYHERTKAQEYFDLIVNNKIPFALESLKSNDKGGAGAEGTHYSAKYQRDLSELLEIVKNSTGGKKNFAKEYPDVFRDIVLWKIYSTMPNITINGEKRLLKVPLGDQPQSAMAEIDDYTGVEVNLYISLIHGVPGLESIIQYARYYNDNSEWLYKDALSRTYHYGILAAHNITPVNYQTQLNNYYYAAGKGVVQYRTGWSTSDMVATLHFSPAQGQRGSHWAFKEGEINIWKHGWQGVDLNTISNSGIEQQTDMGNLTLLVDNAGQNSGDAKVNFFKGDNSYIVVEGDLKPVYNKLATATRTCIVSGNVITVVDKLKGTAGNKVGLVINSAGTLNLQGTEIVGTNLGGQIKYKVLLPESPEITAKNKGLLVSKNIPGDGNLVFLASLGTAAAGGNPISIIALTATAGFVGSYIEDGSKAYVHIVNATENKAAGFDYTVSSDKSSVLHIVSGLQTGSYGIVKQGAGESEVIVVGTDGVLSFTTNQGGNFSIQKK